ncbi:hypothetical protein GGR54DRAFT_648041 [Hypoxylon sp. NC1633]|nr:hypothetical protein GGR54DRAFT_648041 [Hypoxylon sp. NC1633]
MASSSAFQPPQNHHGKPRNGIKYTAATPREQTYSLFVTGLPPDLTVHQLLRSIRNVGKIFKTSIQRPNEQHDTSTATVTLWNRQSADRLTTRIRAGDLNMGVYQPQARISPTQVPPPAQTYKGAESRAIRVSGNAAIVNREAILELFKEKFSYDLDDVIDIESMERRATIEIRFGSFHRQAEAAMKILGDLGYHQVCYARDPCE